MTKYGYKYLLDYAVTHPNDTTHNTQTLTAFAENEVYPDSARNDIYALIDAQIQKTPGNATFLKTIKITMATNYDDSQTALDIFETLTYADVLDMIRKNSSSDYTDEKIEEVAKRQWVTTLVLKSEIENKTGRSKDAIATLRRALTVDPENAMLLNNLGYIMAVNGEDARGYGPYQPQSRNRPGRLQHHRQ